MNSNKKIVAIGEILWDIFPNKKHLGGAPFNFAYHCKQLGLDPVVISAIGEDKLGNEIIKNVKKANLDDKFIERINFPTGTVQVSLSNGQPEYEILENVAWDNIGFKEEFEELAKNTGVVCFGSLASRSFNKTSKTVEKFLKLLSNDTIKIFDINLRQHYYSKELIEKFLKLSDVLKINDEEIEIVVDLFGWKELDEDELLNKFYKEFDLNLIILTKGNKGSVLFDRENKSEQSALKVENFADAVGAGDSFTATVAYGLINDWDLEKINIVANKVAAIVCSNAGGTPELSNIKEILQ